MSSLRVRCLGGFEVWHGESQVSGFESQKTKALFAYLLSHRGRSLTRDHLAGLLWPERDDEAARRNLRQAVYSLKRALPEQPAPAVVARGGQLGIHPGFECWYDVETFERELEHAAGGDPPDPHRLATAVNLYRGDFLAGFQVKDSEAFELWLVTEQERLREKALEALRRLVEGYLARGEVRFGVQYARRLVAIDPLAEEAYRYLMQLHALSGRRSQALVQYEELCQVLRSTMDVEPMPETRELYEAILRDETPARAVSGEEEPIGPLVPLVGRRDTYRALHDCWQSVLDGAGGLTLVSGEAGVGKSRLVKSFLDTVSSQGDVAVLKGRCFAHGPILFQPFPQVLRNALTSDVPGVEEALRQAPAELFGDLAPLVPDVDRLRPEDPVASHRAAGGRQRLFTASARLLELVAGAAGALVVFLDNLHVAGGETFELLDHLRQGLAGKPCWIIAAYRDTELGVDHPLRRLEGMGETVTRFRLERLTPTAVEELAGALVHSDQAADLALFLGRWSLGLPMAITEAINYLWDEGVLVPGTEGRWHLASALEKVDMPDPEGFQDLLARRFQRLPSSTRRLAALSAVMGQSFDAVLLERVADELSAVVEIGLEVLLERWLVRHFAESWVTGGREPSRELWAKGARRGRFEFAHEMSWRAICELLDPGRRKIMHGEVAEALEKLEGEGGRAGKSGLDEALAYHFAEAELWQRALPYLRRAAERARALEAREAALDYDDRSLAALDRMIADAGAGPRAERWRQERAQIARSRAELARGAAARMPVPAAR